MILYLSYTSLEYFQELIKRLNLILLYFLILIDFLQNGLAHEKHPYLERVSQQIFIENRRQFAVQLAFDVVLYQ